jgi:anti-anti-sigma regulatory factor
MPSRPGRLTEGAVSWCFLRSRPSERSLSAGGRRSDMSGPSTFLTETRVQAARIISPFGDLTAAAMPELRRSVARSLSEGAGRIIIDLSGVALVDGVSRAGLDACSRTAGPTQASLIITGSPSPRSQPGDGMATDEPSDLRSGGDTSGTQPRDPICGTFVRGTITGRVLRCADVAGHSGNHRRMRPKEINRSKGRTRAGVLR